MTPRQQKEARLIIKALGDFHCDAFHWEEPCYCEFGPTIKRLHDRARLFLRQTEPKKKVKK